MKNEDEAHFHLTLSLSFSSNCRLFEVMSPYMHTVHKHCTMRNVYIFNTFYILCCVHCIVCSIHCTQYTLYTVYNVHCTLYNLWNMYNVKSLLCTMYIVHCTVYTVHFTLYIYTVNIHIYCTMYTALWDT